MIAGAAIIIFGARLNEHGLPSGAMLDRVRAAFRVAQGLDLVTYIPTGGRTRAGGPTEAEAMTGLLRARGVDPARILAEPTAGDTVASVRACAQLLRGFDGPIYFASSGYHLPRCALLLRIAGVAAIPCSPTHGPASRSLRRRWYWRLRELPALAVDAALMTILRLRGRITSEPRPA